MEFVYLKPNNSYKENIRNKYWLIEIYGKTFYQRNLYILLFDKKLVCEFYQNMYSESIIFEIVISICLSSVREFNDGLSLLKLPYPWTLWMQAVQENLYSYNFGVQLNLVAISVTIMDKVLTIRQCSVQVLFKFPYILMYWKTLLWSLMYQFLNSRNKQRNG